LFWHSHLLNPKAYFADLEKLTFGVPHHKLLPEAARTHFVYNKHASAEAKLWEDEFHEGLDVYVTNEKYRKAYVRSDPPPVRSKKW
jgi:hypothetical protein